MVLTAKAAEMLDLVETPKHLARLTDIGRVFVASDHEGQQSLFRKQLTQLHIFELVVGLLEKSDEHQIDPEIVEEEFAIRLSRENPIELFETLLNWGRYAGLLDYDTRVNKLVLT